MVIRMLGKTPSIIVVISVSLWVAAASQARPAVDPANIAELWESPDDLESRDLFNGPWGAGRAPDPNATYTFVAPKKGGINPGMTVRDPRGREWKVKQPPTTGRNAEGPIEVVLSRVLAAVGYHQPPVYFLPTFTLEHKGSTRRVHGWTLPTFVRPASRSR